MKKVVSLALVCLFVVTMFTACGGSKSPVGEWDCEGSVWTLNKDGSGTIASEGISMDITWEAKGDQLTIGMEIMGIKQEVTMTYSIKGNTMTTVNEDGSESVWNKK